MTGLFPNAWTVARREYRTRVRSRTFQVITLVLALVGIGLALFPIAIQALGLDAPADVAVVAGSADVDVAADAMVQALNAPDDGRTTATLATDADAARSSVQAGEAAALVTVTRGPTEQLKFELYTSEGPTSRVMASITVAAQQVTVADRLLRSGIAAPDIAAIFAPSDLQVTPVDPNAVQVDDTFGPRYVLATVLVILMFMAVITYGQWVAASVAEEKASRVMELLVTAATPRQLLLGKVLGAGSAGLTQYLVIMVAAIAGLLLQGVVSEWLLGGPTADVSVPGLDLALLTVLGLFFVCGFALYATLYAALGSTASRQEDVQTLTGPMVIIGMAGYLISFAALSAPEATWVVILSFVPFFSPYLIVTRMLLGSITPAEIGLALAILLVTIAGAIWVAARIYAAGVLLYGQRKGLREVWRAVRVAR